MPSVVLGLFIGITFTTILTYDECFFRKLHNRFNPRFFENTKSEIDMTIERNIIRELDETDSQLNSIKHFVEESDIVREQIDADTQQQHHLTNVTIAKQLKRDVRTICFI